MFGRPLTGAPRQGQRIDRQYPRRAVDEPARTRVLQRRLVDRTGRGTGEFAAGDRTACRRRVHEVRQRGARPYRSGWVVVAAGKRLVDRHPLGEKGCRGSAR